MEQYCTLIWLEFSFCSQIFLACSSINLHLCAGFLVHSSLSKFSASGAAMAQICRLNEHNKTLFYFTTFMIYHNHLLLFGQWHFLVPKEQYPVLILT